MSPYGKERVSVLDEHGYVQLVETWGSDERVIEGARMSTGGGFKGWGPYFTCARCGGPAMKVSDVQGWEGACTQKCGPIAQCDLLEKQQPGDEKLLRYLWENGHSTPFEQAGITIEVRAPIVVFREWHRHRVPFGYSEASARYAPLPALDYVPSLARMMVGSDGKNKQAGTVKGAKLLTADYALDWTTRLHALQEMLEAHYQAGLENGVPKELARGSMTVFRHSTMRATGNLRGWLAFLKLRDDVHAQEEIQAYARVVHQLVREQFPRTCALFDGGRKKQLEEDGP